MKKVIIIIASVILGFILLFAGIFLIISSSSKKLVCESNEGNITIMYTKKQITGYTAKGITYDLDGQKEYAKKVGVDAYIEEFSEWFKNNTTGTCKTN